MHHKPIVSRGTWIVLFVYALMIGGVTGGMWSARKNVLVGLDTPAAHADWQQWRDEAARQAAGDGPVTRKIPRSAEPPALVLMRDHFGGCLTMMLVICSAIYAALVFFVRGASRASSLPTGQRGET